MRRVCFAAVLCMLAPLPAVGQSGADSVLEQSGPRWTTGMSAGALHFGDGHNERAVAAVFGFRAAPWLSFSINPSFARTTDTLGNNATTGLADLPIGIGLSHSIPGRRPASLGLGFDVSLPVGDTAKGTGSGETSVGASIGLWTSIVDGLDLDVGMGHAIAGSSSGSALSDISSLYTSAEIGHDFGWSNAMLGISADLGRADSGTVLPRSLAGGLSIPLRGPLTFTIDGTSRISGDAPSWGVSMGIGTAFAGVSPVGPTSPLRRFNRSLSRSVNRSKARRLTRACRRRNC